MKNYLNEFFSQRINIVGTNSSLKSRNDLISRLFFSLLPVQVLIYAMGFINTIVDGIMAGRFIDSTTVGVV